MEASSLSEEEANQLLEHTLILISQQNQAEKRGRRNSHSQSQSLPGSPTLPPSFHRKASLGVSTIQPLEVPSPYPTCNSDLSPTKPTLPTSHKISIESEEGQLSGGSSSVGSPQKGKTVSVEDLGGQESKMESE